MNRKDNLQPEHGKEIEDRRSNEIKSDAGKAE